MMELHIVFIPPFYRAWSASWLAQTSCCKNPKWVVPTKTDHQLPDWDKSEKVEIQEAGEAAALKRYKDFIKRASDNYGDARNIPGIEGTNRMSPHLRWGEIHPRMLNVLLERTRAMRFIEKRLPGVSFMLMYSITLIHHRDYYDVKFKKMRYDKPGRNSRLGARVVPAIHFVDARNAPASEGGLDA